MKNFRDIEQLSSYLDGQLSPSESARLESRISSDPELASAFNDIRATRSILRKLPARKAPRNFTLTRQMVGLKPPLPRSYSFFRFSTAFATVLLMLTFAANSIVPALRYNAAPMAQEAYGIGGGGGGGDASDVMPAATEAPALAAAPAVEMTSVPTEEALLAAEENATTLEAPAAKEMVPPSELQEQPQVDAKREAVIPVAWQIGLLTVGLVSLLITLALSQSAKQKWK
jgi:anti-sigma factor RsiW